MFAGTNCRNNTRINHQSFYWGWIDRRVDIQLALPNKTTFFLKSHEPKPVCSQTLLARLTKEKERGAPRHRGTQYHLYNKGLQYWLPTATLVHVQCSYRFSSQTLHGNKSYIQIHNKKSMFSTDASGNFGSRERKQPQIFSKCCLFHQTKNFLQLATSHHLPPWG